MFNKVIPNVEVEIKVYALQYSTGLLYLHSEGNDNAGVPSKNTGTVINNVDMFPAYTYEEAVGMLHKRLRATHDLFIKEVKVKDFACMSLNSVFDRAFDLYGEKDFEKDKMVVAPSTTERKISSLKKELGKSLTDIDDNTTFIFDNGFDGHGYTGKELKEDPTIVHWFYRHDSKDFVPLAVVSNQTCCEYEIDMEEVEPKKIIKKSNS